MVAAAISTTGINELFRLDLKTQKSSKAAAQSLSRMANGDLSTCEGIGSKNLLASFAHKVIAGMRACLPWVSILCL
jgi:hypothetical protein